MLKRDIENRYDLTKGKKKNYIKNRTVAEKSLVRIPGFLH